MIHVTSFSRSNVPRHNNCPVNPLFTASSCVIVCRCQYFCHCSRFDTIGLPQSMLLPLSLFYSISSPSLLRLLLVVIAVPLYLAADNDRRSYLTICRCFSYRRWATLYGCSVSCRCCRSLLLSATSAARCCFCRSRFQVPRRC